jgi:hypothetical protein
VEVERIDLQIREQLTMIRQHQQVVNQLRLRKRELTAAHRQKRKPLWDAATPLARLVNLQQFAYYQLLIDEWQKRSDETLEPLKNTFFSFPPHLKHHVFRALADALAVTPRVFTVSTLELCRYLSAHSDLGDPLAIHRAVYRAKREDERK